MYRVWQTIISGEGDYEHAQFWREADTFSEAHVAMLEDYDPELKEVYLGPCDIDGGETMWMLRVAVDENTTLERGIVEVGV